MRNLSKFTEVDWKDFLNGLITAVLGTVIGYVYEITQTGDLTSFKWQPVLLLGVGAGLSYILKRWFSNSAGEFLRYEKNTEEG